MLSILVFLTSVLNIISQEIVPELQIYGKFFRYNYPIENRDIDSINSQCFEGFGYFNCRPTNIDSLDFQRNQLPYYVGLQSAVDDYYCLQCCGKGQQTDFWDLECPITAITALQYNMYGLVLHMAKNRFAGDTEYVSCPLKRSVCTYDDNDVTENCDGWQSDVTYLHGYRLTGD